LQRCVHSSWPFPDSSWPWIPLQPSVSPSSTGVHVECPCRLTPGFWICFSVCGCLCLCLWLRLCLCVSTNKAYVGMCRCWILKHGMMLDDASTTVLDDQNL
jgi:hypothetical protein